MPGPDGEDRFRSSAITTAADALLSMTGRDRVRLPERTLRLVGECFPVPSGVDSGKGAVVMSNTPRVFVGATTLLMAGMTSAAALQTVTAAMNNSPGVRVIATDRITGLVTLSAAR